MASKIPSTPNYVLARKDVTAALRPGNHNQNLKLAQSFLDKFPQDAFANQLVSQALVEDGRLSESLPFAQFATQYGGLAEEFVVPLVHIYLELGFYESAKGVLDAATERYPNSPQLDLAFGELYKRIGKTDLAMKYLSDCLRRTTEQSAREEIGMMIGQVLVSSNLLDEAMPILEDLKQTSKYRSFALIDLAAIKGANAESPIAIEIQSELSTRANALSAEERARLHLALGRLEERSQQFDSAFASWKRARSLWAPHYDAKFFRRQYSQVRSVFTADLFEKTRNYSDASADTIFIVGMPRSGTTLMEQILNSHPLAAGVGELGRLGQLHRTFLKRHEDRAGSNNIIAEAAKGEFRDAAEEFHRVAAMVADKAAPHYVDKMPTQFFDAGFIHMCMPNARFINMNRHPADTFISTYQNEFKYSVEFAFSPEGFAHYYMEREKLLNHWRSLFPNKILDVRYETLVTEPEAEVRRILDFLELDWDPACLKFFESNKAVRTLSWNQVRQKIHTGSVGRWRNYEKHLAPLFAALKKHGYQPEESDHL